MNTLSPALEALLSSRFQSLNAGLPRTLLLVSIAGQSLSYVQDLTILRTYAVSTSRFGTGNAEGSNKTPTGIHRIYRKIGADAPAGAVFESREFTGRFAGPLSEGSNLILTRILWLEGIEPGINKGPGIDSMERYIYVHGTNHEDMIGKPNSHGCVCMRSKDIIELFDACNEGDHVFIH